MGFGETLCLLKYFSWLQKLPIAAESKHGDNHLITYAPQMSHARKELLEIVKNLRAMGADEDLRVELPYIAVIGNQSAGKSSVVKAISGVDVPRDAGTCTRCPIECRLSFSESPWRCQVRIRRTYVSSGEYFNFGDQPEGLREIPFGDAITNKKDIELVLRRAQAAVLNPHQGRAHYVNMSFEQLQNERPDRSATFSRDVICLDLSGPDLSDLTFVDLPGLVQYTAGDTDAQWLVNDLVSEHIRGKCLILVTMPMNDNIENQTAMKLARTFDPSGERTIGVITKPDTLPAGSTGSRREWLEIFEGRSHQLKHGYYCTRQPDDDVRAQGQSEAEALAAEEAFFATSPIWSNTAQRNRLGTRNLVSALSEVLARMAGENVPILLKQVHKQIQACDDILSSLPRSHMTDPGTAVQGLITEFTDELKLHVTGTSSHRAALVQKVRSIYREFKDRVCRTAPYYVAHPNACIAGRTNFEDNSKMDDTGTSARPTFLQDIHDHMKRSRTIELPGNVPYSAKLALIEEFQKNWLCYAEKCLRGVHAAFEETVQQLIHTKFKENRQLESVVTVCITDLMKSCHETTYGHIRGAVEAEMMVFTQDEHGFLLYKNRWLSHFRGVYAGRIPVRRPFGKQGPNEFEGLGPPSEWSIEAVSTGQPSRSALQTLVAAGPRAPNTTHPVQPQDPYGSATLGDEGSSEPNGDKDDDEERGTPCTSSGRQVPRPPSLMEPPPQSRAGFQRNDPQRQDKLRAACALLAEIGIDIGPDGLSKLYDTDEYDLEMGVMAEVSAYFHIACKRVIDVVPLRIEQGFLLGVSNLAPKTLIHKLELGSQTAAEKCAQYLARGPDLVKAREEQTARKRRLESICAKLMT
ncbi:hypothetical protein OBBRIDRAFT_719052 [Obba rivulosa]|uniref:Uncharacterized protein n=1 Tax=Obba rivulosa TaxID=1052685 RepID=A0A8E2J848_9APHY|nr:hypothetical protein OBBRIDRAFT_719052 [Obba rivulosa]